MSKDSFLLHTRFFKPLSILTREQLGELLILMFRYHIDGKVDVPDDLLMAWEFLKAQFDLDSKKYTDICRKNRENIKKRWNTRNTTEYDGIRPNTNCTDNDNEYEHEDDNDNVNDTSTLRNSCIKNKELSCVDTETKVGIEIKEFFNSSMKDHNASIPRIHKIIGQRYNLLNARIQQNGIEAVKSAILNAAQSDFLNGRKTQFLASFDWIMRPVNFQKVLDGNYSNREEHNPNVGCNMIANDTEKYKKQKGW